MGVSKSENEMKYGLATDLAGLNAFNDRSTLSIDNSYLRTKNSPDHEEY